jgi:hypothetical protein
MTTAQISGVLAACVLACMSSQAQAAAKLASCPASGTIVQLKPSSKAGSVDRLAIQSSIDALSRNGGGTILLSPGLYVLDTPIDPGSTLIPPQRLPYALLGQSNVTLCAPTGAVLKLNTLLNARINGILWTMGRVKRFGLINLTFDGASVRVAGSELRLESNTLRNLKRSATELAANIDVHLKTALFLDVQPGDAGAPSSQVKNNSFENLDGTAIMAEPVKNAVVSGNSFNNVPQPMHFWCSDNLTVSGNRATNLSRIGLEFQVRLDSVDANYPNCNAQTNVTIEKNVLTNWVLPSTGIPDNLMGISTEHMQGTVADNVAVMGPALRNWPKLTPMELMIGKDLKPKVLPPEKLIYATPGGLGIEVTGVPNATGPSLLTVRHNTLDGFAAAIATNRGRSVAILNNAIYNVNEGIIKLEEFPVEESYRIEGNYIHNARHRGISGYWYKAAAPTVRNNLIVRQAGTYPDTDNAAVGDNAYAAIAVSTAPSGSAPLQVNGNQLLLAGSAYAGFDAYGILFAGAGAGGTSVQNNWVGWNGASTDTPYGRGLVINGPGAGATATVSGNTFQGLSTLLLGGECFGTVSANVGINVTPPAADTMCSAAFMLKAPLTGVSIPRATVTASRLFVPPTGYAVGYTLSASTIPPDFSPLTWAFGDGNALTGASGSVGASATHSYIAATNRVATILLKHPNGALTSGEVALKP